MKPIKSIEELKQSIINNDGIGEFFISLKGGLRSSKTITIDDDNLFYITHEIDDSSEEMTVAQVENSLIGEAIKKGALYSYN